MISAYLNSVDGELVMSEKRLQIEVIQFLRDKGAYVLKNDANYRTGTPDWSFWHPDLSGMLEIKDHEDSPYRPLQKPTIAKLQAMGIFCEVIHHENWAKWKAEFDLWLEAG